MMFIDFRYLIARGPEGIVRLEILRSSGAIRVALSSDLRLGRTTQPQQLVASGPGRKWKAKGNNPKAADHGDLLLMDVSYSQMMSNQLGLIICI